MTSAVSGSASAILRTCAIVTAIVACPLSMRLLRGDRYERRLHHRHRRTPAAYVDLDRIVRAEGGGGVQQREGDADAARRRERTAGDLADRLLRARPQDAHVRARDA